VVVFDHPGYDDHERVILCRDVDAGPTAIIAIHDTTPGPAAGGCRMWPYRSFEEALTDVLRLSRAMTYKNALAGLPLGNHRQLAMRPNWLQMILPVGRVSSAKAASHSLCSMREMPCSKEKNSP
jgi:hypothetical protein